jgi:LmbE family N-acetylglucosaminyl deacetylase
VSQESMLVVSAHAADFVWRAGGAVTLAASRGDRVKVLCLTYGERGESASAWRAGKSLDEIKALRREPIGAPPVFLFEPHQPEMCGFKPEVLLDITPVFDAKRKAMKCMGAQQHLWEYYTDLARRRGTQLRRNAGPNLGLPQSTLGEAYMRVFPQVTDRLS